MVAAGSAAVGSAAVAAAAAQEAPRWQERRNRRDRKSVV
jgi:hypothetical protein